MDKLRLNLKVKSMKCTFIILFLTHCCWVSALGSFEAGAKNAEREICEKADGYLKQITNLGTGKLVSARELIDSFFAFENSWKISRSRLLKEENRVVEKIDDRIKFLRFWTMFIMFDPDGEHKKEEDGFTNIEVYDAFGSIPKGFLEDLQGKVSSKWPNSKIEATGESALSNPEFWGEVGNIVLTELREHLVGFCDNIYRDDLKKEK